MSNGFALSMELLPLLVGPWPELNNATPSVRPHYRALNPNTGCSVPVLRLGTLILMGASHKDESTEAEHRDGATRIRIEGSVMEPDRRGCVVQLWPGANQQWEELHG